MTQLRDMIRKGEPAVLLTACGLCTALLLLAGMIVLVAWSGLGVFWPEPVTQLRTAGRTVLGELVVDEADPAGGRRFNLKTGNRDVYGADFVWVRGADVTERDQPADAVAIERLEYGNFYGFLAAPPDRPTASAEALWAEFEEKVAAAENAARELEAARESKDDAKAKAAQTVLDTPIAVRTAEGRAHVVKAGSVVQAWRPNRMGALERVGHYIAGLWEFVTGTPRESNTEGGIWPAIFGTCLMVLLMTVAVVPFGVMAAVYLQEYARKGVVVRLVRIAVANLAGVPSIVFGLFGLGFFVYAVGGTLDQMFFSKSLPAPTFGTGGILWASLTLALLTLPVVIVATEEALAAVPHANREGALALGSTKWEMLRRVVLPQAMPGILTGMILAVARGAGEVAPLMLTGAVKLAPQMPFDGNAPYFHLDRKFMHLGFHIYDLGFQSPNVEAAKPMVYATTLLLIFVVVLLNVTAIVLRARLRKRLEGHAF